MTIKFNGRDLVTRFKEDPDNQAIRQYRIEYACKSSTVVHYIKAEDNQGNDQDGNRLYRDVLTYAENEAAGLTRTPTVSLFSQNADMAWSAGLQIDAQNPEAVFGDAPRIVSTLTGVEVTVQQPVDSDYEGIVAWVHTDSNVPLDATHERYRGKAGTFSLQLPDDDTYYLRIAPYDAFGLSLFSAWDAQPIKRGDLDAAVAATETATKLDTAITSAKAEATKASSDVTTARNEIANTRVDLSRDITAAKAEGTAGRQEAAQVRTDLTPTIVATQTAAKKANDDLTAEIARAKDAEGTITTNVTAAQTRADGAYTAISTATTQFQDADRLLSQRLDTVESAASTDRGNFNTRITNEVATLVGKDDAIGRRIDGIVTDYQGRDVATNARVGREELARSSGDDTNARRIDTVEAQANTDRSNLTGRISDEENARVAGDEAITSRTNVIEASYAKNGALNSNPDFAKKWDSGQTFAPDWQDWQWGSLATKSGDTLGSTVRFNIDSREVGWFSVTPRASGGWFVLEAAIKHYSGNLSGAGVHIHLYTEAGNQTGSVGNLAFASDPDILGLVRPGGVPGGGVVKWSKLVYIDWQQIGGNPFFRTHMMANWGGLGTPTAKDIEFLRCAVRPATQGEIDGRQARLDANTANARITDEAAARVSGDEASAIRSSALETRMGNQEGYANAINAKVDSHETARVNDATALAQRANSLEATRDYQRSQLSSNDLSEEGRKPYSMDAPGTELTVYEQNHGNVGWACRVRNATYIYFHNNHKITKQTGRRIRATCWFYSNTPNYRARIYWNDNDGSNGRYRGEGETPPASQNGVAGPTGGWVKLTSEITIADDWLQNIYAIANADPWNGASRVEGDFYFSGMIIEDITQVFAANARITDEQTVRSNETGALANQLRTIEASATNAGNLVPNTSLATLDGWELTYGAQGGFLARNDAGTPWMLGGVENNLTLRQTAGRGGLVNEALSPSFAVEAGQFYQGYAWTAAHRSRAWVTIFFYDAAGNGVGYAGENFGARVDAGGQSMTAWDITGGKSYRAPDTATRARLGVRQYDVSDNGFAWFSRPYVGKVRENTNQWNSYVAGPEGVVTTSTRAKITDEANASVGRDNALSGRSSTLEAQMAYQQPSGMSGAIANVDSRVTDSAAASVNRDEAISQRVSSTEARFAATPVTFTARSYGNAASTSPFGHASGVWNGAGQNIGSNGRSYGVYVFNSSNVLIAANHYDIYGNGEAADGRGWAAMRDFLNGITNGQAVVITTADEPANNRINDGLLAAMERCGAGDLFYTAARPGQFQTHSAYILVGRAGIGRGNGQEYYRGSGPASPDAWLEVPFQLLGGIPLTDTAGMKQVITNARIDDEQVVRAGADNAASGRISTVESKLELQNGSAMSARISDNYNTLAAADSALANRATNVEAAVSGISTSSVPNDKFANWPNASSYPDKWVTWVSQGNYRWERWAADMGSPYSIRTLNDVSDAESGFYQTIGAHAGKWVCEVTAQCVGNEFSGAGVTLHGQHNIDFVSDPDTLGLTGNQGDRIRTWTKMFDFSQDFINSIGGRLNVHAMVGWSGFGRPRVPKYVQWYRLSVRPATAGEILAGKVNSDVNALTARVSSEETARVNGDNALAVRTETVEAQVSNDSINLLRNGIFNAPNWTGGIPPYWNGWAQDSGAYIGPAPADYRASKYGAKNALQIDRNGNQNGIRQQLPAMAAGWYVVEVDITAEDGNWLGSGFHWNFQDIQGHTIDFGRDQDTNGGVVSGNIGSVNRKFSKLVYVGFAPTFINCYLMAGWEGFATGQGFLRTIWHKVSFRAANEAEIAAKKVLDANIIARVQNSEGAIANVQTKVATAWSEKTVSAGTSAATITMRATDDNGNATSDVTLAASRIALRNTETGGISKGGMVMSGGNAVFDGSITANGGILVGNGKLRVQVQATDYAVSHGQRVDFGYDLGRAPTITFGPCPVSLNSGEVYAPYASDLSATGFTAQLVIQSAPQSSGQSTGGFANQGNNTWDGGKQGKPNAANGTYSLTVNLQATANAYREYNEDYR